MRAFLCGPILGVWRAQWLTCQSALICRCTGFKGDVVGQLIEAPEVVEEKWADT